MRRRALPILGLALAATTGLTGCNELDHEELTRDVALIHSIAAEGALLARDQAQGKTISAFTRVHAGELAASAEQIAEGLEDATKSPDKQAPATAAIALCGQESSALGDLEVSPSDSSEGAKAARSLQQTAQRATRLSASL